MSTSITAEEAAALKERVKMLIKAILCSSAAGVTEKELRCDYYRFNNENLPYDRLGYKSVYDMMNDFSETNLSKNGGIFVYLLYV